MCRLGMQGLRWMPLFGIALFGESNHINFDAYQFHKFQLGGSRQEQLTQSFHVSSDTESNLLRS